MNGEEETGLVYNADIDQCACGNIFEFINDRGVCKSFQLYHSFILQFLAVYKERVIHVKFIILLNSNDDFINYSCLNYMNNPNAGIRNY